MLIETGARAVALIIAVLAWTGKLLFFGGHYAATGDVILSASLVLAYLTDWSTLLVGGVLTAVVLRRRSRALAVWLATATTATILVGLMFAARGGRSNVLKQGTTSVLTHVVVPIAMALFWCVFVPHCRLRWAQIGWMLLFPLLYLVQMFARGALGGGYPYPEVDVSRVGWEGALLFSAGVFVLYAMIAAALVAVDRRLTGRQSPG